ncbi:Uridine kinase [C1] [Salmonella enterica subsp. enterica]|uniref:Uridine kinase [C1] n=1 Tax=Salmonella enterica I TaxID=59201 RepID=A0A3S4F389_SALET|nr:Uridine kinase [C1] [Salmonella enterica subsp. enterica]
MTDQSHQCVIIGIAGASASGKSLIASTLYRELREQVGDEHIGVIPEDSYYKDQSHLSMEERVKTNYDHPKCDGSQPAISASSGAQARFGD